MPERRLDCEIRETSDLKQAREEIRRLNKELEQRVIERTSQLTALNEELKKEIIERKRAEELMLEAKEKVRMILDSITDNFFGFSKDWRFTYLNNHAMEQMRKLGKDPDLLIGKVLWDEFPEVPNEETVRYVMNERVAITDEFFYPPLGEWVENHMYPGNDGGIVTFQRYITERKLSEQAYRKVLGELAHVTRVSTLGELTASIAHEVNQPLAAIVTNGNACLHLLSRDEPDLNEVLEAVECIIGDAMRASEVIKHIRSLLRKSTPEKTLLHINEIIKEVISLAATELAKNHVLLLTKLEEDIPQLLGDRVHLQQVILNLILNSNEAMSNVEWQPRELLIRSQMSKSDEVMVSVRDTGIGLDKQTAERLFDNFFTTKKGGLGLGLSISRSIIEAHGGRIWATANEGKGATFQFTIPTRENIQ
jgi:C4-dicarboxylate-specific signal transduction histidine kinase